MTETTKLRAMVLIIPALLLLLLICNPSAAQDCASGTAGNTFSTPGEYSGEDCSQASALTVTSSGDAFERPGSMAFSSSGAVGWLTWSVEGTEQQSGASIDQQGNLSLDSAACGSYTVTVTDACQRTASKTIRTSNEDAGEWADDCDCQPGGWKGDWHCCSCWATEHLGGVRLPDEESIVGDTKTTIQSCTVYCETTGNPPIAQPDICGETCFCTDTAGDNYCCNCGIKSGPTFSLQRIWWGTYYWYQVYELYIGKTVKKWKCNGQAD